MNRIPGENFESPEYPSTEEDALAELEDQMAEREAARQEFESTFQRAREERSSRERESLVDDQKPRIGTDGFESSCFPEWLKGPTATAALALSIFSAVGGQHLARGKSMEEADRIEANAYDARLEAFDAHFDQEAKEVREGDLEVSPETLEGIANALEHFSVEGIVDFAAASADLDPSVVAENFEVSGVHVYDNDRITVLLTDYARSQGMSLDTFKITDARYDDVVAFATMHAGVNLDGNIYLNATVIEQMSEQGQVSAEAIAADVLEHEAWHGYEHNQFNQLKGWSGLYEGLIEMASNESRAHDHAEDAFSAYTGGPLATAELLRASLDDETTLWRSIVLDQPGLLEEAFNEQYAGEEEGGNLFRTKVIGDHGLGSLAGSGVEIYEGTHSEEYKNITALVGLIDALGDQAPALIQEANAHISEGNSHIYTSSSQDVQMVALVSPNTESGYASGYVKVMTEEGARDALLVADAMGDDITLGRFEESNEIWISDNLYGRSGDGNLADAINDVAKLYGDKLKSDLAI
jgi:hypothetical protein